MSKTMKKFLFWAMSPITFIACLLLAILEGIGYSGQETLHKFEGWCFNYKDTGLIYHGDGIWSSPHGDEK